jgi:hypothetical protein
MYGAMVDNGARLTAPRRIAERLVNGSNAGECAEQGERRDRRKK